MKRDEDRPFEADVNFMKQREYYSEFAPTRGYFFDWLSSIYWELQGTCGPIEYATRVCIAREIVQTVNVEHAMSSHLMLKKVLKNLFPYDMIKDPSSPALRSILGNQRGKVRFNKFRTLQDHCIKNETLIALRYHVLAEAFCSEAKSIVKILRENVDEEKLPIFHSIGKECLDKCNDDLNELIKARNMYYLNYPQEHLYSVSNITLKNEDNFKKRSDMPKDMEPEYIFKVIAKHTTAIRNDLQAVLIQAKEICGTVEKKKKQYYAEINDLLIMCSTIKGFVTDGPFDEIANMISELGRYVEDKFSINNFLPEDILSDLKNGNSLYRNGYLRLEK